LRLEDRQGSDVWGARDSPALGTANVTHAADSKPLDLGIVRPTDLVLVVEVAAYNSPAKNRGRLCVKAA
jgi:hypothetical protein